MIRVPLAEAANLDAWINPDQVTTVSPRGGREEHTQVCMSDGQKFFVDVPLADMVVMLG